MDLDNTMNIRVEIKGESQLTETVDASSVMDWDDDEDVTAAPIKTINSQNKVIDDLEDGECSTPASNTSSVVSAFDFDFETPKNHSRPLAMSSPKKTVILNETTNKQNPWASLSQKWSQETNLEVERISKKPSSSYFNRNNHKLRTNSNYNPKQHHSNFEAMRHSFEPIHMSFRANNKRSRDTDSDEEDRSVAPNNIHARLGNKKLNDEEDDDDEEWTSRLAGPRMSMHADEEEKKIQQRVKRQPFRRNLNQRRRSSTFSSSKSGVIPPPDEITRRIPIKHRLGKLPSKIARVSLDDEEEFPEWEADDEFENSFNDYPDDNKTDDEVERDLRSLLQFRD